MGSQGVINKAQWKSLSTDLETIVINESSTPENFSSKCLVVPIVTSAFYGMDEPSYEDCELNAEKQPYFHSRKGNPTRNAAENLLAKIEGSEYALTFSSGSAAINCVLQSLLSQGDHVVSVETAYGGTITLLKDFGRFGISVDFDNSFDYKVIASLVKETTKIVWLESPANPTMKLIDIEETVKLVRQKNPKTIIIVDNTFLTAVFQRPLEMGVDIALYSCSKYLNGHADVFMGSISCDKKDLFDIIKNGQEAYGAIPSSYDCYNLIRSLKTLPLRMKQHFESAQLVAEFLENHPCVEQVLYPGLKSHPQHSLALKQQFGNSSAIGIYLKGGLKESYAFLKAMKLVVLAPSLGTDMSIANLPCKLSHGELTEEERQRLKITDNYIRLSVGLENAKSIIKDLDQALRKAIRA